MVELVTLVLVVMVLVHEAAHHERAPPTSNTEQKIGGQKRGLPSYRRCIPVFAGYDRSHKQTYLVTGQINLGLSSCLSALARGFTSRAWGSPIFYEDKIMNRLDKVISFKDEPL